MATEPGRLAQLWHTPVDAAGLAVFRILFAALMLASCIRFVGYGWVEELYLQPSYHFTYPGFSWVRPWPAWGMYLHFAVIAASALTLMLGFYSRVSALVLGLAFTYVELIDETLYLNHYYLASLLCLMLGILPSGACFALDARHRSGPAEVGLWCYAWLRAQLCIVYAFAGLAKLNADWLVRAEPLRSWLANFAHIPVLGPQLARAEVAYFMSWGGAAYDCCIWLALLRTRSRPVAYIFVVLFHISVWALFPIGVFSWVMIAVTTIFFSPDWPRRWWPGTRSWARPKRAALAPPPIAAPGWIRRFVYSFLTIQLLLPLRFLAYPGDVNWHEQGFRFAWRVMLVEKAGHLEYRVESPDLTHPVRVFPQRELTPLQFKMLATKGHMIHHYAQHIAGRFRARGLRDVAVYADAWVAYNGRASQRFVDPRVDLCAEPWNLAPATWILPRLAAPR